MDANEGNGRILAPPAPDLSIGYGEDEEMEGDDEVLGLDVLGDPEVLGAIRRMKARGLRGVRKVGRRMLLPGVQAPGERKQMLPFPVATMGTSAAGVIVNVTVNPQRPYRGVRLVAAVRGEEAGAAFSLNDFRIANKPQPVAAGPIPLEAFGPGAFELTLDLDSTQPGVEYLLSWIVDARGAVPTAATIVAALWGYSLS